MKLNFKLIIILVMFFCLSACFSSPSVKTEPVSLEGDLNSANSAVITFGQGIGLIDLDGQRFSENTSFHAPIRVPAGKTMNMRVYIYWDGNSPGNRRRGIFKCPQLEAGKEYRLRFNYRTTGVFIETLVDGYSIVLEKKRDTKTIFNPPYDTVITQTIPPLP